MAQYFTPSRFQTPSWDQDQHQSTVKGTLKLELAALDESAVYIFRNGSSAPTISNPVSPSQASDFSIPTELTLSAVETDSSGGNRPPLLLHSPTPAWESQLIFPEPSYDELQTPISSVMEGSSSPSSPVDHHFVAKAETGAPTGVNPNAWRVWLTRYRETLPKYLHGFPSSRQAVDIKTSSDEPLTTTLSTQCEIMGNQPLPFISLILSLFSIDASTAELLKSDHQAAPSILFPGQRLCALDEEKVALVQEVIADGTGGELHGLAKLLVEEKFNSQHAARRAFWDVRHNTDNLSPTLGSGFS